MSVQSSSILPPSRSQLPEIDSSAARLSTVRGVREDDRAGIRTSDAPSLPFVVVRTFTIGDPTNKFRQLFPGQFPVVEEDIGHGASFIVQKTSLPVVNPRGDPTSQYVALKRIRPNSPSTRQSFVSVVADLICLSHPPLLQFEKIVSILGLGWEISPNSADSRLWPYLILEYSSIGTISDLQQRCTLTYSQKKSLCCDVAEALLVVHHANIIHGDVKSENILVFPEPDGSFTAKLSDFGYATMDIDIPADYGDGGFQFDHEITETRISTGTYPWTAPECGHVVSWDDASQSDVYSWGLLVWRVFLDGKNPFIEFNEAFRKIRTPSRPNMAECIKTWKEKDDVLAVALQFAAVMDSERENGDHSIRHPFENSLRRSPSRRDLMRGLIAWKLGRTYGSPIALFLKGITLLGTFVTSTLINFP